MTIQIETQFIWIAIYSDGSQLVEYEELSSGDTKQHFFQDIELERCVAFILHPVDPNLRDVTVKLSSYQRLIFFRRYPTFILLEDFSQTPLPAIHVVGFQETVKGVNKASYLFIFSDGSMLLSDDFKAV